MSSDGPGYLPRVVPITGYGAGGFRFADMSHRGALLILPSGMYPFEAQNPADLTPEALLAAVREADGMDVFIFGMGDVPLPLPDRLRYAFGAARMQMDAMTTSAGVRTVNVLASENRRFGAVLLPVSGGEKRR